MTVYDSSSQVQVSPEPTFLSGWKDIAGYLGKGVRTVQRYEVMLGLPVRRPSGSARGAVIALRLELERWVSTRSATPSATTPSDTQTSLSLKIGILELRRLWDESLKLRSAIIQQHTALQDSLAAVVESQFVPDSGQKAARHEAIAAEQKARAKTMIATARSMSDRAIAMRQRRRWFIPEY